MDYSQYKQFEFRRKVFAWLPQITMTDPLSGSVLGFIKMRFRWRNEFQVYRDNTMQQSIFHIKARSVIKLSVIYDVLDSVSGQPLFALQHRGLRSIFKRDYWDLIDLQGNTFGAVQETSGALALARRWLVLIPYLGGILEACLAFTPQTFDILSTTNPTGPLNAGHIIHRKNPFIVKMNLDTSAAQVQLDARIGVSVASLLAVLDAGKNN